MTLIQYILLFIAVFLGGALAFRFREGNSRVLKLVLSFCGSYLLGVIVLHLLPDIYSSHQQTIGIWVLVGYFIQLLLEQLSMGVEHGHIHNHYHTSKPMFAAQVMLGLSVHAFIEGMPLSMYDAFHATLHAEEHQHGHLYWGIIMHKAPEAFALALLLLTSKFSIRTIVFCLLIFSAMSPMGAMLATVMQFSPALLKVLIAIVVGSLLHISTTILFESDSSGDEHKISFSKVLLILLGVGLSLLTLI